MKSEPGTLKVFASLRFRGDQLEPSRLSEVLDAVPTIAYRKGEVYKRSRGHAVRGRTGLWVLSTDGHVSSTDLVSHLGYLLAVLFSGKSEDRVRRLRDLMREEQLDADVSCFWYGKSGSHPPVIPEDVRTALARLSAKIETDFHTD